MSKAIETVIFNRLVALKELKITYLGEKMKRVSLEVALNPLGNVEVWDFSVFTVMAGL